MIIRRRGYFRWNGELKRASLPWIPIWREGIYHAFSKKLLKATLIMSALQLGFFVIAVYITSKPELSFIEENIEALSSITSILRTFYVNGYLIFTLLLLSLAAGSELIAGDLKTNAVALYFSRPLGKWDYIAGKMSIIGFYMLCVTLLPGLILILLKAMFSPTFTMSMLSLFSCVAFSIIVSLFFSSLTLLVSSLTDNGRFVGVIIFVLYFLGLAVYGALNGIFKSEIFSFLSIYELVKRTGNLLFGRENGFSYFDLFAFFNILFQSFFFIFLLYSQVSKMEKK
ncbi:hypothetical protein JXA84_07115 [candidate division WOR-3 bacterium]|nr:hypothetical protein [candidate division WOR-3 bacterium]